MSQRIVIETPCGHGWVKEHGKNPGNWLGETCPGGSREVLVLDEMVEKGAVALGNRRDGWKYDDPEWWRNDMRDDARAVLVAALGLEETNV